MGQAYHEGQHPQTREEQEGLQARRQALGTTSCIIAGKLEAIEDVQYVHLPLDAGCACTR